jgi:hypothetical protein
MVGRTPSRGSGGPEDPSGRDEERRREREARLRSRERAEQAAEDERAANIERLARRSASDHGDRGDRGDRSRRDAPSTAAEPLPAYAAPATRAGRDRVPFQPLAPAEPVEAPRTQDSPRRADPRPLPGAALVTTLLANPRATALAGAGFLAVVIVVVAVAGGGKSPQAKQADAAKAEKSAQASRAAKWAKSPYGVPSKTPLPPDTRVVAFTGAPRAKALGILGVVPLDEAAARLKRQSVPYARKTRPVLRSFDLIATVASAYPGPAGKYRTRQPSSVIARYLRAARRHHETLMLDVQPGQSNFVDELRPLERWLREPDVQLALDPEWRMRPGIAPGHEIGWVSAGEVQATLDRVARIVQTNHLPPKLVVVHRFTDGMIRDLPSVKVPRGIVGVISIDGVGAQANKVATYNRIAPALPKPWLAGFKLFYTEDAAAGGVMSGKAVMALKPRPSVVLYE